MPALFTINSGWRRMEQITHSATELPTWVTTVGSALVFFASFAVAAYGWFKAKFPTEVKGKPAGGDAVVLTANIADSKSINKLADAIEVLCDNLTLERDLSKLQHEVLNERLKLILGELRKFNERADNDRSIGIR